jgi:hypothetical protein
VRSRTCPGTRYDERGGALQKLEQREAACVICYLILERMRDHPRMGRVYQVRNSIHSYLYGWGTRNSIAS